MAGFGILGMPMGNDNSSTAKKARKEALARIALLKNKEMDPVTYGLGETVKFLAPNPQLIKQAVMDPVGTVKGAGLVASYASPAANSIRFIESIKNNRNDLTNVPLSLLQGLGKDFTSPEVQQAIEIAGIIPTGKAVSIPLKFAEKGAAVASRALLKGVEKTAARTSANALSAASGGLIRGGPVKAARSAPEPSEFDKIINAAKAEDPTLGNVAPEGTAPPAFRSELDWDENMSVNYDKAVKKISDDLLMRQRGALGEDPTLINPLIDDSIAALDSEIGNLMGRNYNHNDLEDFLGKIAAPDDYTVADATLAKRADDFISEIDTESIVWGADPEAWLLDVQFNMDAAAKKAVKSGTTRLPRRTISGSINNRTITGADGLPERRVGLSPSSNNPRAPRGGSSGSPKDPMTGNYMNQPNERRFASGASILARAESQSLSSEAANKATQTAINRLKRQLNRELNIREIQIIRSKAKESGPEFYTAYQDFASHPDNYDRIVKVAEENQAKIKALDEDIASVSSRNAKKKREQLKTEEITRQNAEFAQAHDPSKGLKDTTEQILTGKISAVGGIQITSKNANDLDNAASLRYDKLFKSGDPIISVEFPDGKPDSWAKIVDWGIKNSPRFKKYLSMPDGLNQMRYDLYLTHLI
jgi:hypothetical protein